VAVNVKVVIVSHILRQVSYSSNDGLKSFGKRPFPCGGNRLDANRRSFGEIDRLIHNDSAILYVSTVCHRLSLGDNELQATILPAGSQIHKAAGARCYRPRPRPK